MPMITANKNAQAESNCLPEVQNAMKHNHPLLQNKGKVYLFRKA